MKHFYFGLLLAFGTAFTACEKDMLAPQANTNPIFEENTLREGQIRATNGRLSFPDTTQFLSTIRQLSRMSDDSISLWQKQYNFTPFTVAFATENQNNPGAELPYFDQYLAHVLSKDQIVEIDNYIFKLDITTDRILVMHIVHEPAYYTSFINKRAVPGIVYDYSMQNDIFEIIYAGNLGKDLSGDNERCRESGGPKVKSVPTNEVKYSLNGENHFLDTKYGYQSAGIYFSLMMEMKHLRKTNSGFWTKDAINFDFFYEVQYKQKCKTWYPRNSKYWNENFQGQPSNYGFGEKHNHRFYQSTRSLSKYYLKADYRYRKHDLQWHKVTYWSPTEISHGW